MSRARRAWSSALLALVACVAIGSVAVAQEPPAPVQAPADSEAPDQVAPLAADTRPPRCSYRFRSPNPRQRTIDAPSPGAYLHEMSNYPTCAPYGAHLGTMRPGSRFVLYHADPYAPLWCYGYSVQLAVKGYVLCSSLKA